MSYKQLVVPIFDFTICLFDSVDDIPDNVARPDMDSATAAMTIHRPENDIMGIVLNPDHPLSINTVAHEAVHVAMDVLDTCKVDFTQESHEILAYLTGWLVEQFCDQFNLSVTNN